MGVVRYLCITIFLVSLAVSALAADRDAGCTMLGRVGADGNCLCESGVLGAQCENGTLSCGAFSDLSKDTSEHYPTLDLTTHLIDFSNNILSLSVSGPLVNNRSYTDIKFVGSNTTKCALGSADSVWKLSADEASCSDRLALSMHWTDHSECKFSLMSGPKVPADVWQFRAVILVSYVDRLPDIGEEDAIASINRRTSASYEIFVQFTKEIRVNITEVVVYSDASLKLFLTEFTYNPDTMQVRVAVTTWVAWPNQVKYDAENLPILQSLPDHLELAEHEGTTDIIPVNTGCGYQENGSPSCRQILVFYLRVKDAYKAEFGCSAFNGIYVLNMTLSSCRTNPDNFDLTNTDACPWIFKTPNFTIVDHYVCGNVSVQPTISGDLTAYIDDSYTVAATDFNLGSRGYFEINIKDNANVLNLTIIDIYANPAGTDDEPNPEPIYFIRNKAVQSLLNGQQNPNLEDPTVSIVDLKLSPLVEYPFGPSASDIARAPRFDMIFDGWVFRPKVSQKRIYGFNVVAQITYIGNEGYPAKREIKTRVVDFAYKPSGANVRASMDAGISHPSAITESDKSSTVAESKSLLTAILPVAGVALVVIAGAVIAAVIIIKKKSTNAYTPFSN